MAIKCYRVHCLLYLIGSVGNGWQHNNDFGMVGISSFNHGLTISKEVISWWMSVMLASDLIMGVCDASQPFP